MGRSQFLASEFYNDFFCRYGQFVDSMGVCLQRTGDVLVYVASHRHLTKSDYGPREWEIYAALFPHLQRATAIQRRLGALELRSAAGEHVLDRITAGVFLLGGDGTVLHYNAAGRRLMEAGDGLMLTQEGRLCIGSERDCRRVGRAIAEACRTGIGQGFGAGCAFKVARVKGRPLGVVVSPLRSPMLRFVSVTPAAVVLVTDPDCQLVPSTLLWQLYGLTPAEVRLACLLASGRSVEEAADELSISRNTARWTLKQVFAKTDTTRQAALVQLLLTGPAGVLPAAEDGGQSSATRKRR
jgi:DNA-binding CsgD family transcriptional regulator